MERNYEGAAPRVEAHQDRARQMQSFVDITWDALRETGISWIGFYLAESDDRMILAACRDTPACSPIGMHGACGQAFKSEQPLIVRDVAELGDNYIACDPRDKSEVVIPLFDESGRCWGVLDADSHEVGAFEQRDVDGLGMLLRRSGLTSR